MQSKRRYVPASQYCASVRDGTHDSPKPVQSGRHLVTSRHLIGGRVDLSDAYLISETDFEAINKRSKVDRWDVLVSMIGTVGEVCLVRDEPDFAIKNIGLFKTKSEIDGRWLYYYLRSLEAQRRIREQSRGTTQEYIPLAALRDFPVLITDDISEREEVVHVLGTFDKKIELNRRMNGTLERIVKALFKSWFVDFEPVRAKLTGFATSFLAPSPAGLFPFAFDEVDDSVTPKDWTPKKWGDLATLEYGKGLRGYEHSNGKYRVFGTNGPIGWHDQPLEDKAGIIIGRKGAYRGVHFSPEPFFVIDTAFYLKPKQELNLRWAYYELLRIDLNGMDSGSAIPSTSRESFYGLPVCVPPLEIQNVFGRVVEPLFAKIYANQRESEILASLRDALLPKLLFGKLRARLC